MNKRLEKVIDSVNDQAHRFDKLEEVVATTASQIELILDKQDNLLGMMQSMVKEQGTLKDALEQSHERSVAVTELFLRLSNRVDTLEQIVTPIPGNGSGESCF